MNYELKYATKDDVQGILDVIYPHYFNESMYKILDYDPEMARLTVENWIENICVVCKDGEKIVAVASMFLARTYYKQTEANVEMFYILPKYRGKGISRAIVQTLVNVADANNCAIIYTSCAGGVGELNNNLYTNLYKKFNFNKLGTEMVRINV